MAILDLHVQTKPGNKQFWGELHASGRALAVAEAALNFNGLSVLITETAHEASTQSNLLHFFTASSELPVYTFPDWETLPYDIFSPHQDIISARLQTLANLPSARQGILVVPMTTLMHRLAPSEFIASRTFCYRVNDQLDRNQLQNQLIRAGYQKVETVYEHGEYAYRGSLVDIFPMGAKNPLRIDLMDDDIEEI